VKQDSSFSEEKEAKRLSHWHARQPPGTRASGKRFLVLFFKKEHPSLPA
jgi:hypothetical protein